MIMNMNTNNVGGRRLARGRRDAFVEEDKPMNCQCNVRKIWADQDQHQVQSPTTSLWSEEAEGALMCTLKKVVKMSKKKDNNESIETKLLHAMMALNVGNYDNMTEDEMRLLLDRDYDCQLEMARCSTLCPLLSSMLKSVENL